MYFSEMLALFLRVVYYSEVVQHDEFLALPSSQVSKLISSDRLTVASEEQVRTYLPLIRTGLDRHDIE